MDGNGLWYDHISRDDCAHGTWPMPICIWARSRVNYIAKRWNWWVRVRLLWAHLGFLFTCSPFLSFSCPISLFHSSSLSLSYFSTREWIVGPFKCSVDAKSASHPLLVFFQRWFRWVMILPHCTLHIFQVFFHPSRADFSIKTHEIDELHTFHWPCSSPFSPNSKSNIRRTTVLVIFCSLPFLPHRQHVIYGQEIAFELQWFTSISTATDKNAGAGRNRLISNLTAIASAAIWSGLCLWRVLVNSLRSCCSGPPMETCLQVDYTHQSRPIVIYFHRIRCQNGLI